MGGSGTDFFTINSSPDQFTESNLLKGDYIVDCEFNEIIYFLTELALLLLLSAINTIVSIIKSA